MGEVLLEDDTMSMYNFNAMDTLRKGMYLLGKTLVTLHQYQADAWIMNAYMGIDPDNPNTKFDAGRSTIRAIGDISPPMFSPGGFCNIRTYGAALEYHNIEFGDTTVLWPFPPWTAGLRSMLKSESHSRRSSLTGYSVGNI
jgi:hypothetical protein